MRQSLMVPGDSSHADCVPTDARRLALSDWRRFFRQGLQYRHPTRRLYDHLARHCGFVVRRGKRGSYETWVQN